MTEGFFLLTKMTELPILITKIMWNLFSDTMQFTHTQTKYVFLLSNARCL